MSRRSGGYEATELRDNEEEERFKKPLLNSDGEQLRSGEHRVTDGLLINESQPDEQVKDKYLAVYAVFLLFGIACLLPWNIFINATEYFVSYKLNTNSSRDATYTHNFTFITGMIGQVTNVVMNLVNIFIVCGGNPKNRIPFTIALSASIMAFQVILAILDSTTWPFTFFILCCVSVFIMYLATGVMQSCIYYVASILPAEYTNAVILGNNLSGIFTSLMNILSKVSAPNLRIAAIFYFLAAFVALAIAFIGYFLMHRMKFFRHYSEKARSEKLKADEGSSNKRVPYFTIIKKIWLLLFCIWLNFFSTLAIFPVFQLFVNANNPDFLKSKEINWFYDIVLFLTFNISVTIGNLIPKFIQKPGPKYIWIPVVGRAVFAFSFFAVCNYKPDVPRSLPILITSDYGYWAACAILPMIFGYLTSLLMMYTPRQVEPQYAGTAGMLASLALVIGVTTGLNFSIVYDKIVLINYGSSVVEPMLNSTATFVNSTLL